MRTIRMGLLALASALLALSVALGCGDDEPVPAPVVVSEPEPEPSDEPGEPEATAEPSADEPEAEGSSAEPVAAPTPSVATVDLDEEGIETRPLPEKMANRIRSRLRETHDARVLLRESIHLAHADGRATVYGLYAFSEIEQCTNRALGDHETRREAFRACREELFSGAVDYGVEAEECIAVRVVRAELEAPEAGRPADWGGAITLAADVDAAVGCVLDRVRRFALADPDGDHRPELEVDVWGHTPERTFRGMAPYENRSRGWSVLRGDTLEPQASITLVSIGGDYEQMEGEGFVSRVSFDDANGDGHADIVEQRLQLLLLYSDEPCEYDEDTGWPAGAVEWDLDDGDPPNCRRGEQVRHVWTYSPSDDAWTEPGDRPR